MIEDIYVIIRDNWRKFYNLIHHFVWMLWMHNYRDEQWRHQKMIVVNNLIVSYYLEDKFTIQITHNTNQMQ